MEVTERFVFNKDNAQVSVQVAETPPLVDSSSDSSCEVLARESSSESSSASSANLSWFFDALVEIETMLSRQTRIQ